MASLISKTDIIGLIVDNALGWLKGSYGKKQAEQVVEYVREKQKVKYVQDDGSIAVPAGKVHLFLVLVLRGCAHAVRHGG